MTIKEIFPAGTKIIIDNSKLQQISHLTFGITYELDKDLNNKLNNCDRICGTVS
jgi:hypothetical protein